MLYAHYELNVVIPSRERSTNTIGGKAAARLLLDTLDVAELMDCIADKTKRWWSYV